MSESKRFITQGAIKLNNMQINDKERQLKRMILQLMKKKLLSYYKCRKKRNLDL